MWGKIPNGLPTSFEKVYIQKKNQTQNRAENTMEMNKMKINKTWNSTSDFWGCKDFCGVSSMQDLPTKGQFNHMCTKLQLWEQYYKKYILTFTYAKQKFKIFSAPGFFDIHHDNTHEKILAKSGCLKGNAWNLMNYIYFSFFQVLTQTDFEKVYSNTFPFLHRAFI